MSEPSIARARRRNAAAAAPEKADPRALPLKNGECDTVFLLLVAHELRRQEARLQFFREVGRALKPGGCVVFVEHLQESGKTFWLMGREAFISIREGSGLP